MKNKNSLMKGSFWGAFVFYFITAFEFFYMAGPFAAYFYSAYAPALNFFHEIPMLSWLNQFFLPHAVRQTKSMVVNAHEIVGAVLAIGGFTAFCIGACQIYYHKLAKKGIVTGGIYNYIRHPQYISFMICSFGMLLLWPRYIVAVTFVTMIFAYYLLAKLEEKECSEKFGESYIAYKNKTNMFFPFEIKLFSNWHLPKKNKAVVLLIVYLVSLLFVLGVAKGLHILSINSLYLSYTENSVDIAVCELSEEQINDIMEIVKNDKQVATVLSDVDENSVYLNYILPSEWYAAEIPMNGVEVGKGHLSPGDYDETLFKVIITKVTTENGETVLNPYLLTNVHTREPIAEIRIDLSEGKVIEILDMPENVRYSGIPVAIY